MTQDILQIQVRIHFLFDDRELFTTERTQDEIPMLFNQINRIWNPARIQFTPTVMIQEQIDRDGLEELWNNMEPDPDFNGIDLYFLRTVCFNGGTQNGATRRESGFVFIRDETAISDFVCIAYEFGHVLQLEHAIQFDRLMEWGGNGETLSENEIESSRNIARNLI